MLNLSQQEYVSRIDELNQALIHAWEQDQRVKALKIAIQVGAMYASQKRDTCLETRPESKGSKNSHTGRCNVCIPET